MNWYYADAGQQTGPVDDAQFEALAQSGIRNAALNVVSAICFAQTQRLNPIRKANILPTSIIAKVVESVRVNVSPAQSQ